MDSSQHKTANGLLHELISQETQLFVSPLCLDEFLHAIRLKFIKENEEPALQKLEQSLKEILDLPDLNIVNPPTETDRQLEVVSLMKKYSLRPRDAYHLLTIQANKINGFATFDNDFQKVFQKKLLEQASMG